MADYLCDTNPPPFSPGLEPDGEELSDAGDWNEVTKMRGMIDQHDARHVFVQMWNDLFRLLSFCEVTIFISFYDFHLYLVCGCYFGILIVTVNIKICFFVPFY